MAEVKILLEGYMEDLGDHNYDVKTTITLIQGKNNIVVDTGNLGQDKEITDALNKEGLKPKDINYVVLTHSCPDHDQNNFIFKNAKFIDGTSTYSFGNKFYVWQGKKFEIEPGITVERLPGHTPDDVIVFVEAEDGIFAVVGDSFFYEDDWEYSKNFAWDQKKLETSRKEILGRADFIIPGHGAMFKA